MNLNLLNEAIAALIGLITTVLVPYLNKRFGTNIDAAKVDSAALSIATNLEKRYAPPVPSPAPPAPLPTLPPTNPNEIGK